MPGHLRPGAHHSGMITSGSGGGVGSGGRVNPDPDLVLDLGDKRVNGGHKQLGGKRWVSCSEPRWVPPGTDRPADRPQGLTSVRQGVFRHLVGMERPEPTRLLLRLAGDTDAEAVRELLVREQGCGAFLSFTITPGEGQVVANLQVPADAAPTLDAMAMLAELAAPEVAP
jgi:hypothetical protein